MIIRKAAKARTLGAGLVALLWSWAPPAISQVAAAPETDLGQPSAWRVDMQGSASVTMDQIRSFHNGLLLPVITGIVLFVLALILYIVIRFNKRANPVPSKVTHNTTIEIAWTIIPILILVVIAIPSFRLHYAQMVIPNADITVKVTGYQWRWSYEYPDLGISEYFSDLVKDENLKPGQPRLLTTTEDLVVPINKTIRVQATGADVIHAFFVPAFGVKTDAIPGRLNEIWFRPTREGVYHGQCYELCGVNHAFMPITVRVVNEDEFSRWAAAKKSAQSQPLSIIASAQADID